MICWPPTLPSCTCPPPPPPATLLTICCSCWTVTVAGRPVLPCWPWTISWAGSLPPPTCCRATFCCRPPFLCMSCSCCCCTVPCPLPATAFSCPPCRLTPARGIVTL